MTGPGDPGLPGRNVTGPAIRAYPAEASARMRSIAARIRFISPRTAEYHLHTVFSKLGVGSRRQLRHHLALA